MSTLLFSTFVYFFTAFSLFSLGRIAALREKYYHQYNIKNKFFTWEISLALLIFAILSGLRWNVGVDYQTYLNEYIHAQKFGKLTQDFEYGFEFLTFVISATGLHYSFYFGILGFLQLFFTYLSFKNQRYLLPYVGIIIILGFHYFTWMNGIRQMLAATIFLYSIQFIYTRKLLIYLFMISIAAIIHKSALILIPLYFFSTKDIFYNRYITVIITLLLLYMGIDPTWIELTEIGMSIIVGLVGYDAYAENINFFIDQSNEIKYGPRVFSLYGIFILVVIYSEKLKKYFSKTNFLICYNIYIIGFMMYGLFMNTNHIFLRPITYLTICGIPTVAYLLYYLYSMRSRSLIPFIFAFFLSLSYTPISIVADLNLGDGDYSNYKVFFLEEK